MQDLWIGYRYDDTSIASLIHALKFGYRESLGADMGRALASHIAVLPSDIEVIIPIPLDSYRAKERGFNQAFCLAKQIALHHDLIVDTHTLIRTVSRAPQATLDAHARATNIHGVYAIDMKGNIPRSVLLIDDVTTTGATLREAV
ncbi:MAG: ComF family protein, partial [Patescibacteria group bacterium]